MSFEKEPTVKYTLDIKESVYKAYELNAQLKELNVSQVIRPVLYEKLPVIEKENEKLLAERARKK